ncbi:MAG: hypothetical protein M1834_001543 [Cirrosporium novae-zelandiae]|nr:MAG: hypothetical protein M1834_004060 [Cirrosporium novae-zelandiae]KAI9735528.1 MAG: hypothetical protein M1834_001543 [Cirrosporium novae-zelandiae]
MLSTPLSALCALIPFIGIASAVNTIEVSGSDFVDSETNERFQIIGIDYQPGGSSGYSASKDPLSNGTACLRDAIIMQKLGVNTLRVYNLDGTISHDECASIFNAAGIYMLLDVNSPLDGESINRDDPSSTYTSSYLKRIFQVVEAFKSYPNTLGFFSGNEVINDETSAGVVPPYMRAVTRDLKNYIAKQADRSIPVGYSAADVRDVLADTWEYLQCAIDGDDDDMSRIDFFGLNSYSWCGGDATYSTSGYDELVAMFANTTVPVFFSEYGCNEVTPRVFDEVQALYSDKMTGVFSGGLVYEYSEESNDYGLVEINDNGTITLLTDFVNLYNQYLKLDTDSLEDTNSTATSLTAPTCKSSLITDSSFYGNWTIPSIPSGGQSLINNGVTAKGGSIVSVSDTSMSYTVSYANGTELTGLKLNKLSSGESNLPGENTSGGTSTSSSSSSSSSSSGSSSSSTSTSGAAAGIFQVGVAPVLGLAAIAAALVW